MEMTVDTPKARSSIVPMAIVAMLFFVLGFATWLNGSLMPYLKQMLQLSPLQASLVVFSFYIAVTFTALPSAWLIRRVGYKNGMALGMAVMMLAGLLYIPAATNSDLWLIPAGSAGDWCWPNLIANRCESVRGEK